MISKILLLLLSLSPNKSIDHFCLTATIYGEARGESEIGQALVAQTVLNRVNDPRWSATVCDVVMEERQFAGYGAAWPDKPEQLPEWQLASEIASAVMAGAFSPGSCGKATHFHATSEQPAWSRTMRRLCRVDNHIFYLELKR